MLRMPTLRRIRKLSDRNFAGLITEQTGETPTKLIALPRRPKVPWSDISEALAKAEDRGVSHMWCMSTHPQESVGAGPVISYNTQCDAIFTIWAAQALIKALLAGPLSGTRTSRIGTETS